MAYGDGYADGYGGVAEDHPAITVEIAFATTPFVTPTWTDVTGYVVGGSATRGRTSELDRIRAGQATITLANEDRRFDPTHAGGPHYPNVLPMRRIRLRAVFDAVTYDVFNGYIDRWEQVYDHPSVAYAVVSATDAFKVLAAKDLPSSVYAAEVLVDGPVALWRLNDSAGSTVINDDIGSRSLTMHPGSALTLGVAGLVSRETGTAMTVDDNSVVSGFVRSGPLVITGPPFSIEIVYRHTPGGGVGMLLGEISHEATGGTAQVQIIGTNLTVFTAGPHGLTTYSTSGVDITDGDPHHIVVTLGQDHLSETYVDGVLRGSMTEVSQTANFAWSLQGTTHIGQGLATQAAEGTYQMVAIYNTVLSTPRIAAHAEARATPWNGDLSGARLERILDLIDWPAADRDIDTGESTLQSATLTGSALSSIQKIEESEGGLLFVTKDGKVRFRSRHNGFNLVSSGIFGDGDDTELEYTDIAFDFSETLIYNEIRVSRADGVVQAAEDTASQDSYGERTFTSDGLLIASDAESLDRANFLLGKYKDPMFRTTRMVVEPSGANAVDLFPQVLGREIGDKLTVRRKPQNVGVTIDQAVIVEGMKHTFADRFWSTEFMLSPSSASSTPGSGDAEYLQLDDTDGPGLDFVRLAY